MDLSRGFGGAPVLALAGGLLRQVVGHEEADAIRPQVQAEPIVLGEVALETAIHAA